MKSELIDESTTPDGVTLKLSVERGHYVLRVGPKVLMSSACHGSERAMATVAAELLPKVRKPRVLVGGLGMGHTLRATLDAFGPGASITVAELLPAVVGYNRGVLAHLADRPLDDDRVTLFEGDVTVAMGDGPWDVILLDVDNGPDAMVARDNKNLYGVAGSRRLAKALTPGGVAVVWSAYPSQSYVDVLTGVGLRVETRRMRARWPLRKGATHVLFIAQPPGAPRLAADSAVGAPRARERKVRRKS